MQVSTKIPLLRLLLGSVTTVLILAAIMMELLPEDQAKVFVVPTLVAALFVGVGQTFISKRH